MNYAVIFIHDLFYMASPVSVPHILPFKYINQIVAIYFRFLVDKVGILNTNAPE